MTMVSAIGLIFLLPVFTEATFRIVGGRFENITNVPYQAGIDNLIAFSQCGGVILSKTIILTAAHCLERARSEKVILITVGTNEFKPSSKNYKIKRFIIHPKYKARTLIYDVAILEIDRKLNFSSSVQAAILPKKNDNVTGGTEGVASGWGATDTDDLSPSPLLKSAKLSVYSQKDCEDVVEEFGFNMPNSIFCATGPNFQDSACRGDSGGPFVTGNKLLRGIASWGDICGKNRFSIIFSKVAFFLDFINQYL